ncbi:hypothetical protein HID58_010844, partial [Brassica napus]
RDQRKRRRVDSDVGNTTHKPRKKKSMLAMIAIKCGVQLTTSERMAEDFEKLTGGILLSRNEDGLVFYRGKNFLSPEIDEALVEQEKLVRSLQEEEEARLEEGSSALIVISTEPSNELVYAGTLGKTRDLTAECGLVKVEEYLQPAEQRADIESITGEERFICRKRGSNMKAFLLIGRRGVFNGTVENKHLHWKYGELVKRKALARSIKLQRHEGCIKETLAMHARAERMGVETELTEKIEDFRRVKKLLTDVRFEPVSSRKTLLPSREQMRTKELLLEKHLEENEEQKAEEEEKKMIQKYHKFNGCEQSQFPILCQSCFCDNLYLRMVIADYKIECKPSRTERYKKPDICQTYSKLKNRCQVCLLDLEKGLPVQ